VRGPVDGNGLGERVACAAAINRGVIMMTHYILTERAEHGNVIVHFGPFASQDAAMNYVESERRTFYGDFRRGLSWSVDPLERPPTNRGRRSRKELLLLGWQGSTINPHHPDDVAAQSFSKTINLDGSVDRED
jgi:hypothetical protein